MPYWLDLFTGPTWEEFQAAGSTVTGFRKTQASSSRRISIGDIFLCYLTGVKRWVGALEVIGPSSDARPIWKVDPFPVRFDVRPLVVLPPDHGIPMEELESLVPNWRGLVRRSPNRIKNQADGDAILQLLRASQASPVERPVDPKKLARKPFFRAERQKGRSKIATVIAVPEPELESGVDDRVPVEARVIAEDAAPYIASVSRHIEIQYDLLWLGAEMGLDVWVARNDRSRSWQGNVLGSMPRNVLELPVQFNEATQRTIELIDVLWLKGNSIIAAFEIESTTSIYSGLLRMSDLLALQPNLAIDLYIVAPDERAEKVQQEILRPTFALRERPLPETCGYLPFSGLTDVVETMAKIGLAGSLRPDFLQQKAIFFSGTRGGTRAVRSQAD